MNKVVEEIRENNPDNPDAAIREAMEDWVCLINMIFPEQMKKWTEIFQTKIDAEPDEIYKKELEDYHKTRLEEIRLNADRFVYEIRYIDHEAMERLKKNYPKFVEYIMKKVYDYEIDTMETDDEPATGEDEKEWWEDDYDPDTDWWNQVDDEWEDDVLGSERRLDHLCFGDQDGDRRSG